MSKLMALENITWQPSPNFDERGADTPIDMLVLHYTGMRTAKEALDSLTDAEAKVSAHYFVDEDGEITSLVPEEQRAWHAGMSEWRGESNINARSIGIEVVNPGHEFGYRPFPERQMAAVKALSVDIVKRHQIPAWNVVGHSDVAPDRKEDPGELFDWRGLSDAGVGLWFQASAAIPHSDIDISTGAQGAEVFELQQALREIGYGATPTGLFDPAFENIIRAFQRHWRAARVDGIADPETQGIVYAVLAEVRRLT